MVKLDPGPIDDCSPVQVTVSEEICAPRLVLAIGWGDDTMGDVAGAGVDPEPPDPPLEPPPAEAPGVGVWPELAAVDPPVPAEPFALAEPPAEPPLAEPPAAGEDLPEEPEAEAMGLAAPPPEPPAEPGPPADTPAPGRALGLELPAPAVAPPAVGPPP